MLKVKEITSKSVWDGFVSKQPIHTFFQSFEWGEFSHLCGDKVYQYGFYEGEKLVGVALVLKVFAKRGTYLFCPHGPIFNEQKSDYWKFALEFFKNKAREEKVDFVRVSPVVEDDEKIRDSFKKNGFKDAPIHMSAESSWILNLKGKSEEELLSEMRKTTRYEIRKAQKNGFTVKKSTNIKDMKHFLKLYHHTVDRTNFIPFSDKYLMTEFETFAKNNRAMLFLESHGKKVVAALMVIFYGRGAYYHQGATRPQEKEAVSYLAQWEAIKEAQSRGCDFYNFWGIAGNDSQKHPWYGLSLFKKGFGGQRVSFVHAQDFAIKPLRYFPTYVFESFRRIKRGL